MSRPRCRTVERSTVKHGGPPNQHQNIIARVPDATAVTDNNRDFALCVGSRRPMDYRARMVEGVPPKEEMKSVTY
ncbi:hypothetical protein FF1_004368 [Malus domestica]